MSEQITLKDIARESGVSVPTVSLALRNRPGVSDDTRRRVLDAAEGLGYQLKQEERPVQAQTPKTIGLIIKSDPDAGPRASPFYSFVVAGIEDACRKNQLNLLYANMPVDADNHPVEAPALLMDENLKGLLTVGAFLDETLDEALGKQEHAIVLVDAYSRADCYDAVVSDNFTAAYQAVEYLIRRGHQHIGLIGGGPSAYPSLRDRYNGYRRALKDNELGGIYLAGCELRSEPAYQATLALLRANPQITALMGCNDEVAIAGMQAIRDLGRKVPDDISVIGYDDIELSRHVIPALTTMQVDKVSMGQFAVQLLLWRLENPEAQRMTVVINTPLRERESVRALYPNP